MKPTRRQFLVYSVFGAAILAFGGKALKDQRELDDCVNAGMELRKKAGGAPYLTESVKRRVTEICRSSGRERR